MKYKPLIAGLALAVVGLAGCSSSGSTPTPGESGSSAPAAAASSQAPAAPAKSLEDMLLTGEVAGFNFQKAPDDVQDQAGGLADIAEGLKIEPAKCKVLVTQAVANAANADAVVSVAQKDTEGYAVSVMSNGPSLSEARANAEECKTFKIDIGVPGAETTATTEITDLAVDGVTDAYLTVTTIDIAGQKQSSISAVGQVGETTVAVSGAGTAKRATVEEVFTAQVEKINS